jgi:hypothetical protein|tara:strand:+ start:1581 stop:2579 length:999 start_codon:yes stop_codon:yes gene_type:complete
MEPIRQRIIPISEFAEAMRASDDNFAARVHRFEQTDGQADSDTLAVLAQACYFCWFEIEYERDYLNVCRAVGAGKPTSLYLCRQISPRRWTELNGLIVAVQVWLGMDAPADVPAEPIEQVRLRLGDHTPEKDALAQLFVCNLAVDLLQSSLAKLSGSNDPDEQLYGDYSGWYSHDGNRLQDHPSRIEHLKEDIRRSQALAASDAEELITGILQPSQPPCQHRYARYQEIAIASIGALRWRGNLPPDILEPKYKARTWFEEEADLSGWLSGKPANTKVLQQLYELLGTATDWKRAILRDFLRVTPAAGAFFNWLETKAKEDRTTASLLFNIDE